MSILDINIKSHRKHFIKTIVVYLVFSVIAEIVSKVYDSYGHGVHSSTMNWMFLYPLLGGALFYLILALIIPGIIKNPGYRIFLNIYNSGIALLTFGSFLKGILYIAGTDSPYLVLYYTAGKLFISSGLIILIILIIRSISRSKC